jgi:predicted nucleotidyltransferase component of viral defense system
MSEQREGAKLVEILHLALLQVMPSYLPVASYVVKGGANLRLFFGSRRRSQDIDFDYLGSRFDSVEGAIDAALASRAFRDLLRVAGVEMSEPTKPKQTATTRRWKFQVNGPAAHLNTKIEFSAREADPEHAFEAARSDLGRAIGLRVVKAEHYLPPAAIRQKIRALGLRSQAEPRDVFDLDLLFATHADEIRAGDVDPVTLTRAIDAAFGVPYEAYRDLVVQYLEDEFVPIYGRPEVWTDMTLGVVERLEHLR